MTSLVSANFQWYNKRKFFQNNPEIFSLKSFNSTRLQNNVPYTGETAKNAPSDQTAFKFSMIRFATGAPGNFAQNCASRLCISKTLNKSIVLSSTYNLIINFFPFLRYVAFSCLFASKFDN